MQNTNQQTKSLPSDILAKNLICSLDPNKKAPTCSLTQILGLIKEKKNHNYQSLTTNIDKQLKTHKVDLVIFIEMLKQIGEKTVKVQNTEPQIKSIACGFKKYLTKQLSSWKIKRDILEDLTTNYFNFQKQLCPIVCLIIQKRIQQEQGQQRQLIEKQFQRLIIEVMRNRKITTIQSQKCCFLINTVNLYKYFKIQDLIHIIRANNSNDIYYFFRKKNGELFKELIQAYVVKECTCNQSKVKKIIDHYHLNASDYPCLVKNLNKKSLRYLMKNQQIYQIDDKIKMRPDIAECIAQMLIDQGKQKLALHFINKHYLTKYYHLNKSEDRSYNKNILQKFDNFEPTEHILQRHLPNGYNATKYLTLEQLGFKQKQIIMVSRDNLKKQYLDNIIDSPCFGIDSQNGFTFNQYEKHKTSIVQICVDYEVCDVQDEKKSKRIKNVFIFDVKELAREKEFVAWVEKLCAGYKGLIIGHTVKKDFQGLVKEVCKGNLNTGKLKFDDVAEMFKQLKNQNKCSLEYICQTLLKRNISKFEQCSGWQNRPLRKAQIHYAALDSVLPLLIHSKLN